MQRLDPELAAQPARLRRPRQSERRPKTRRRASIASVADEHPILRQSQLWAQNHVNLGRDQFRSVGDLVHGREADAERAGGVVPTAFGLTRHAKERMEIAAGVLKTVA